MLQLLTDDNATGKRLDQWLADQLRADFSRARLQTLIREGEVRIGGCTETCPRTKLLAKQVIEISLPLPKQAKPEAENMPLDIIYEDEMLIVINKPSGLVVHPGHGNETGTLVNALLYHCGQSLSGIGGVCRPGIVHRLDKDTSGVMVVAKNDVAHRHLSRQFADHGRKGVMERRYLALVWGRPTPALATIDAPIGRDNHDRTKRRVVNNPAQADARHAITHFCVKESYGENALASLIECRLETGRTHQIRVHMAYIGHPLIGDKVYGSAFKTKANRLEPVIGEKILSFSHQALHAYMLAFSHPRNDKFLRFERPIPPEMAALMEALRQI